MNHAGTFAGGLAGAGLGAVVWIGVGYATGYELGILAVLVGIACGIGAALGAKGRAGTMGGVIAGLCTIIAIVGARFVLTEMTLDKMLREAMADQGEGIPGPEDGEFWTGFIADHIIDERVQAGEEVEWPESAMFDDFEDEDIAAQYPSDVWDEAASTWASMGPVEREDFCAAGEKALVMGSAEDAEAFRGVARIVGALVSNLHPMALVIMGIAVVGAFKVARDSKPVDDGNEAGTVVIAESEGERTFGLPTVKPPEPARPVAMAPPPTSEITGLPGMPPPSGKTSMASGSMRGPGAR